MALVYPVAGCIREFGKFGMEDGGVFFYNVTKAIVYSLLLNSGIFLIAILICCYLQDVVRATSVTAIIIFALSLYLGYGMMLQLPVAFFRFIRSGSLSAGTHLRNFIHESNISMPDHITPARIAAG